MSEYFSSDGTSNHLVEGPWAVSAFCGTPTSGTPVTDDDPSDLCWSCAPEWADRTISDAVRLSEDALMTAALIDQLIADGQLHLAEGVLRDAEMLCPELFAEVEGLRSRSRQNLVVAA